MKIIFCEECGGRNSVTPEQIEESADKPPVCQFCGNLMSSETIVSYNGVGDSAEAVDTSQYSILVIDDDTFYLEMAKSILGKDYTISVATSGEEGIAMALDQLPDLILLDVQMPGMDGYDTCMQLKKNRTLRHIPILFVSARSEGEDEYKGLALGAVDYICKPLQLDVLNARINLQFRLKLLLDQEKEKQEDLQKSLLDCTLRSEEEQEQLVQEKNNFQAIVNTMQEMVTIEDTRKRIVWVNQSTLKGLDKTLSELLGRHCYEVYAGSTSVCPECPVADGDRLTSNRPVVIQRKEGEGPPLDMTHLPLFNEDGDLTGIAHIVKERTAWLV